MLALVLELVPILPLSLEMAVPRLSTVGGLSLEVFQADQEGVPLLDLDPECG